MNMTNPSDERISALVDGELNAQEHQTAVDELLSHDDKRAAWGRYHLMADTLKRSLPKGIDHAFSSRVMAALEDEPTVLAPPPRPSWGQRAAGLAVAASVAAVAVLGVQFMYQQDGQAPAQQLAQVPAKLAPTPQMSPQNIARANLQNALKTSQQPSFRANIQTVTQALGSANHAPKIVKRFHPRLNKYLVDHNQQTSRTAMQAVIPYARIVAYPNSRHTLIQAQK
jgi:sigma-E factor negative regulatory protein RseA